MAETTIVLQDFNSISFGVLLSKVFLTVQHMDFKAHVYYYWYRFDYLDMRGCNQKFPDWLDNEIYAYNNKHSLRSNTKGYGGNDSPNNDTTSPRGRELYHLQFSRQAASPETFGYNLVL
jgi:hypothetical protein